MTRKIGKSFKSASYKTGWSVGMSAECVGMKASKKKRRWAPVNVDILLINRSIMILRFGAAVTHV